MLSSPRLGVVDLEIVYIASPNLGPYLGLAPIALIIYDYLLTLDVEIQLLWSQKLPRAAVLLSVLIRLVLLWIVVISLLQFTPCFLNDAVSRLSFTIAREISLVLTVMSAYFVPAISMILTAIVSTMRVYAVTMRNKYVTLLALCLGISPVFMVYFQYSVHIKRYMMTAQGDPQAL
ncbi:uncharacterized protein B0H18DRAFT_1043442 [Fomitopsis serialis]|uniref:uncharacterized protein n=1 Tax=Fomitopsis serialis TaxID=139415 RepID=UPI00200814AD|nr:uncharacterized protein B0H18DRAFT_1043442 [Neoantrodia serialis]KAH9914957.1 hypothetical protein B0H18DRAFT_1043442 [Neoantrodia serialis]